MKLTLDEKIAKVTDSIKKEEALIAASKEKIKKYNAELKILSAEKEKEFANSLMKLLKEKGISQTELLSELQSKTAKTNAEDSSSLNDIAESGIHSDNNKSFKNY